METVDDIVDEYRKQRNHMKNKGDSWIEYSNYEKHYIEDTKRGHKITLLSKDGSKLEINCVWPDRERDYSGRVSDIKKEK
jgi:hypothetical protein